jgi:hypothetical protein
MDEKDKKGYEIISDTTFIIVLFVVVFLYYVSAFMYVYSNQFYNAQIQCKNKGGIDKYYIHFGAEKFTCKDGTTFVIKGD